MDHVIINALSDLRHLAVRHDVDFLYCNAIAYQIYLQEKQAENTASPVTDEE